MEVNVTDTAPFSYEGEEPSRITFPNGSCVPLFANSSYSTSTDHAALFHQRILLRIPMWIFSACSLYIAVMLTVDAADKTRKVRKENYAVHLKVARLIATWFTTFALMYFGFEIFLQASGKVDCNWHYRGAYALHWSNNSVIYFVLWLRQRIIYSQRSLHDVVTNVTSFLSYATVVMVIVLPFTNTAIFWYGMTFCYEDALRICRIAIIRESSYYSILIASEFLVPVLLPLTLLVLFAWPLIQYHKHTHLRASGQKSVIVTIRRIAVATFVCFITDVAATICNDKCEEFISPLFRHLAAFCNVASLLCSFSDWKFILFPHLRKPGPTKLKQSSINTLSS